jgi:hypothetical protein
VVLRTRSSLDSQIPKRTSALIPSSRACNKQGGCHAKIASQTIEATGCLATNDRGVLMSQNDSSSNSSDDSEEEPDTPSLKRNRDGTLASGTKAELKLAKELAKDPWGRFGGRNGKLARIREQEAAMVAAMEGDPIPPPPLLLSYLPHTSIPPFFLAESSPVTKLPLVMKGPHHKTAPALHSLHLRSPPPPLTPTHPPASETAATPAHLWFLPPHPPPSRHLQRQNSVLTLYGIVVRGAGVFTCLYPVYSEGGEMRINCGVLGS